MEDSSSITLDEYWMKHALNLAVAAGRAGEVPVGALITKNDRLIAEGVNQPITTVDPTAHAEIIALRAAAKALGNYRLPGCTMYVTIEPCSMCAGALVHARVERLVYGAPEPRTGAVCSAIELLDAPFHNHRVAVTSGVMQQACSTVIQSFFRNKRLKS